MKRILILMALLVQTTLAGVFQDTNNPVAISVVGETDVQLATSRRVDQPTLRYQLEKTDDLTNTWSVVSTYKGDGSVISLLDGAFSVSNAAASAEFETVDFSEALSGSSRTFYRMSHWWVSTPLSEYTDDIDATYVRLRSRDGLKYLYQDPATGVVSYEAGMDIMDFRSHWYIQTSRASGQYWIFNRMTGDAIRTTSGGNLAIDALGPFSFNYRWIFHEEAGFFWIENVSYSGEYLTVDPAASGDASYAVLDPGSEDQKFIIELLPRGAMMPWLTYDQDNYASIGNGAQVLSPTYDRLQTHSEAQKRSAILLNQEQAFVKWTLEEDANAFVLRYAIEDAPSGGGLNGTVSMIIRDGGGSVVESGTIPVTSEQAWVYFDINMNEYDAPGSGRRPAKRFNEARVKLSSTVSPGYSLELRRDSGEPLIWIDVVETELIDGPITVDAGAFYNVTSYGATPDDGSDDRTAFVNCINAAISAGKGVYIPAGVFRLSGRLNVDDVVIQGAGMWHTELDFTSVNGGVNNIGFWGYGSNIEVHDLYMRTESTERGGGGNAFRQYFGTGSRVDSVWMEHFDVGGWIGDYISPYSYSDGLTFFNCRVRNTFADGINFARGTRNSVIDNSHFRATGDDSMASWSSDTSLVPQCENNRFRYNTVEITWRAAGIGIFGGEGHIIHHNLVSDIVSGAAMRFNTTFANGTQGYEFSANGVMSVYKNSLYRSGTDGGYNATPTKQGAINLVTTYGDVQNIAFSDIYIDDVLNRGVFVDRQYWGTGGSVTNITFNGMVMTNMVVGTYVNYTAIGSMEYTDVNVSLDPVRGVAVEQDYAVNFDIIHLP